MKGVIGGGPLETGESIHWAKKTALAKAQKCGETWHCLKIESGSLSWEGWKYGKFGWKYKTRNVNWIQVAATILMPYVLVSHWGLLTVRLSRQIRAWSRGGNTASLGNNEKTKPAILRTGIPAVQQKWKKSKQFKERLEEEVIKYVKWLWKRQKIIQCL